MHMADLLTYDSGQVRRETFSLDALRQARERGSRIWVDVSEQERDVLGSFEQAFGLHHLTIEDLTNLRTRIKIEDFDDYLFIILYSIRKSDHDIDLIELDFVIGNGFLITNHPGTLETFETIKQNNEKLALLFKKGIDFLFHRLLDKEIDNFFPVLEQLDEEIETIEENVIAKATPELLRRIHVVKRQIATIKHITLPQREKIASLAKGEHTFISPACQIYFRDIYDHAIHVSDSIETYRESASNTLDIYLTSVSNTMNEVMKILSIIATIILPLSFVTGLYGMNFQTLPGAENPSGFWVLLLFMIAFSLLLVMFFRSKRWI